MCSDTQNYQQAELKKNNEIPVWIQTEGKIRLCVCVCAVGG